MNKVAPRFLGLRPATAAVLVIAALTLFRFFYCTWLPMLPDETYYFQWSRQLDASYFSKGPAVAYTIAAGTKLFGDNPFGVRFFAVLLSAGTAWQIFLLARRWYDETAGLIAVLLAGVIPLYAVGAVLMTIDPLSAFFWIWAANLFSQTLQKDRLLDWLLAGFAVGSGFLGKYLNALELLAFVAFLALVPARRQLLRQGKFWLMLLTALICMSPVFWWNQRHHWISAAQLGDRGHLELSSHFSFTTFVDFLAAQSLVISPLIFLLFIAVAVGAGIFLWRTKITPEREGKLLLLLLFLSIFFFYAVMAFHIRCEPNWPAVSYLSLVVLLAGHWRELLASRPRRIYMGVAFCLGWLETVCLHDTAALPLPRRAEPLTRTAGWTQLAAEVERLRVQEKADVLLADGYQEASAISFELPGQPFIAAVRHVPPANQFDIWPPRFSAEEPHRILWITDDKPLAAVKALYPDAVPVERVEIFFRGVSLRVYRIYLCRT